MKICRIYERVSTDDQDLTRQRAVEDNARATRLDDARAPAGRRQQI